MGCYNTTQSQSARHCPTQTSAFASPQPPPPEARPVPASAPRPAPVAAQFEQQSSVAAGGSSTVLPPAWLPSWGSFSNFRSATLSQQVKCTSPFTSITSHPVPPNVTLPHPRVALLKDTSGSLSLPCMGRFCHVRIRRLSAHFPQHTAAYQDRHSPRRCRARVLVRKYIFPKNGFPRGSHVSWRVGWNSQG